MAAVFLSQAILLSLLWLGDIDFNMYTLPAIVLSAGAILSPTFIALAAHNAEHELSAFVAIGLTVAASAVVWLFSPLRLQAEMGELFIVVALLLCVIPLSLQKQSA
jgi:hypothetical protein